MNRTRRVVRPLTPFPRTALQCGFQRDAKLIRHAVAHWRTPSDLTQLPFPGSVPAYGRRNSQMVHFRRGRKPDRERDQGCASGARFLTFRYGLLPSYRDSRLGGNRRNRRSHEHRKQPIGRRSPRPHLDLCRRPRLTARACSIDSANRCPGSAPTLRGRHRKVKFQCVAQRTANRALWPQSPFGAPTSKEIRT